MTIFTARFMSSLLCSAAMCAPMAAAAQEQAEDTGLEVIMVNAQRRAEGLQSVPIAVSAFSGDQLVKAGVFSLNTLETLTPSLEIEQAFGGGQPQIRLRGVGFDDYAANNTPAVGIYVDEVAYPIPAMTQGILFDMASVEVLYGPQGTLYGRNTTGGAVNFVTNDPTDAFTAGGRAEFARFGRIQTEGFISGGNGKGFRARLAAIHEQGGAWQFNRDTGAQLGDANRTAVRGIFEYETGALTARLTAHYYNDKSDGLGLYLLTPYAPNGLPVQPADIDNRATGWGITQAFADETGLDVDAAPFRDNEGYGVNLRLDYDLGAMTATSLTSYESLDRREFNDWDGTAIPAAEVLFNSAPRVFQQELRLASNPDAYEGLNWIGGLYFGDEQLDELYQSDFQNSFGLTARTPYEQTAQTFAIYGQGDYQILDRLTATLGLRYENESRNLVSLSTVGVFPTVPPSELVFVDSDPREVDMSELSGRFGLDYQVTGDVLAYASISRGVKSGGFTALNTLNPLQTEPFRNETLWAYEAGLKSELLARTLRVNVAAFYYDYTDQQIQGFFFDPGQEAIIGRIVNVPKSNIYGFEIDTSWSPIDGLVLNNAIGWKRGEFSEFDDVDTTNPTSTVDRAGERLPFPALSYTGSLAYSDQLNENYAYNVNFNWTYRDDLDKSRLGSDVFNVDAFWLVNAQVGFGPADGSWQMAVFARNLTNTDYDETRNFFIQDAVGNFVANGARGRPAEYGVSLSFTY